MSTKKGKKGKAAENIRVVIRVRDLLPNEVERGDKPAVRMDLANSQVIVQHAVGDPDLWTFDAVYNNGFSQRDIYLQEVHPLVEAVLQGYNATVFAYGQSGSGKTFTMTGKLDNPKHYGMMPQVVEHMFNEIKRLTSSQRHFKVKVSYIELYLGKSRDLLTEKQVTLEVKENMAKNFYVKGAEVIEVLGFDDCIRLFNEGTIRRQVASTDLNDQSSRSHSLFMITIEQYDFEQDPTTPVIMTSKINVVDLAGSEKLSKTNATGDTAKEGCQINLSLSALATVIDTIVKGGKHIPYRSSSLTMLLKDSLGGNAKTVMFANIGPSDKNVSESISTLRFADRAKQIENKPIKNMDPKDARIADLLEKIEELQARLGNVDLNEEEKLKIRIEELEVENASLRGNSEKDTLQLEEDNKNLQVRVEQLQEQIKGLEKEIARHKDDRAAMEVNFKNDLDHAQELKSIAANFVKRVCTQQQLDLIREHMPAEVKEQAQGQPAGTWDVREIQFYLEGFLDLYDDWRQTAFTESDVKMKVQAAREEITANFQTTIEGLNSQLSEHMRQRDDDSKSRNATTDTTAHLKAEAINLKDENAKLKEKIERDQERFKQKLNKNKDDQKKMQDELDVARSDVQSRERDVEKLKKLLEETGSRAGLNSTGSGSGGGGAGGGAFASGSPSKFQGGDHQKLLQQLEDISLEKSKLETHMRDTNLMLRRKGLRVVPGQFGDAPPPPGSTPDGESAAGGSASGAAPGGDANFTLAGFEDEDSIDPDVVTQLQQQVRIQHRLLELRHNHQRRLDDLVRKYELLKTGTVTALPAAGGGGSGGEVSQEVLDSKVREALEAKEAEIAALKAEHEKTTDKLVKKINKKLQEFNDEKATLIEEKQAADDERADLTKQCDELSKFNTEMAVELETLRAQMTNAAKESDSSAKLRQNDINHLKSTIEELKRTIEGQREKIAEYNKLQQEHERLQSQLVRSEATVKEKLAALDNNRQLIKWTNGMLETEKKKVLELEDQHRGMEKQFKDMEENWRQQLIENANKLVAINNKRLEEQAAQYQGLIGEEQEKQKAVREKLKKAKSQTAKAAQRYDEMVLENETLQTAFEDLKVSAMKMYRQQKQDDMSSDMYGMRATRKF